MELRQLIERAKDGLRWVRHKNRLRYKPGTERISIDQLISPLRFDVSIRIDYFCFFAERQDLFQRDFDAYLEGAYGHRYFVWFREIHCRRLHPELLRTEDTLNAAFVRRLRQSAALYRQFHSEGFDKRYPIMLHSGKSIRATGTLKTVKRDVYMGDGCHRVALLKLAGHKWLEPDMYITRTHATYLPPDNTGILLDHLGISLREYLDFLSMGYGDSRHMTQETLLDYIRNQQPHRLAEVMTILSCDQRKLS